MATDQTAKHTTQPNTTKHRRWPRRLAQVIAGLLIFVLGFTIGSGAIHWQTRSGVNQKLPNRLDYSSVDEVYRSLKANYDGTLNANDLINGAKSGLVKAAGDPYTVYFTPKEYQDFNSQLSGSFTGIGAELSQDDKGTIIVVAPIKGFPAEKAGIRPKDIIAEIDGQSTSGMSVAQAVDKIRGPKGTQVKLKVVRDGKALDFTITRDDIKIPSVDSKVENGIGIIKISRFGDDTAQLVQQAATDFKQQNVKGVVLDLRSNPGGLLDAAVSVSSLWLPNGKTILTERRDGVITNTFKASGTPTLLGVPTAVLIDEGSASASEITAGALKDNGAATVFGKRSFGKGSVQDVIVFRDGGALKVTIARWYTPNGKNITKEGISPDKSVDFSEDAAKAGQDPQKAAALEWLNSQ